MPAAMPPVRSMTSPEARMRIKSPAGPASRMTPRNSTSNVSISVPRTTVFAVPRRPGWTASRGYTRAAARTPAGNSSSNTKMAVRRTREANAVILSTVRMCLKIFHTGWHCPAALRGGFVGGRELRLVRRRARLVGLRAGLLVGRMDGCRRGVAAGRLGEVLRQLLVQERGQPQAAGPGHDLGALLVQHFLKQLHEIGRASCREGVQQPDAGVCLAKRRGQRH